MKKRDNKISEKVFLGFAAVMAEVITIIFIVILCNKQVDDKSYFIAPISAIIIFRDLLVYLLVSFFTLKGNHKNLNKLEKNLIEALNNLDELETQLSTTARDTLSKEDLELLEDQQKCLMIYVSILVERLEKLEK